MKQLFAISIIILLIGAVSPSTSFIFEKEISFKQLNGETLYVGGNGPGNYSKIQDAIDNASDGDTVFVFNGTYFGHININKSINLFGEDKNLTYIIGFVAYTLSVVSNWVNMSGFTIQNNGRLGEGVRVDSCNNNLFNNIIDIPNDEIRISATNNTINANSITSDRIYLSSNGNIISNNIITNNYYGIYLTDSSNNIISNNSFFNCGLFISEDIVLNNIVKNNTVNDKPLVYIYDKSDLFLDIYAGQIICINCTNITIQNQKIVNTTVGIQIWTSNSCILSNNIVAMNLYGIYVNGWDNKIIDSTIIDNDYSISLIGNCNTISSNTVANNNDGIYLRYSNYNKIVNNTILNNSYSILLDYGSDYNSIIKNTIIRSYRAILLSGFNNIISYNTISNNEKGIFIGGQSKNNTLYHNNFNNNKQSAYDTGMNIWDNDYPSGGNYWDDYTGNDSDGDGIGDTPYPIPDGDNKDRYPLMDPHGQTELDIGFISGGLFKIKAEIKNIGRYNATKVNWTIRVLGKFPPIINYWSGLFDNIELSNSVIISTGFVIGFGKYNMTITAEAINAPKVSKSIHGIIFLFFILIRQ